MLKLILMAALAASPGSLQVEVAEGQIQVSDVTPGHDVYVVAMVRTTTDYRAVSTRYDFNGLDSDRDGAVVIDVPSTVAPGTWRSLAIEPLTGRLALPARSARRRLHVGRVSTLTLAGDKLEVLLVRPGVGVWSRSLADGSTLDLGPAGDRDITFAIDSLASLDERRPAPQATTPSDLLLVVDRRTFAVTVWEVMR